MDVRNYFLHELKDQGMIVIKHNPGDTNDNYIATKNVTSVAFTHHVTLYVWHNEYASVSEQELSWEAV